MTQVMVKSLPNGKIPVSEVRDSAVRNILMRIVENQVQLGQRMRTVEKAVIELQGTRR